MLESFRALILAIIILIVGFLANAALQETVPTIGSLRTMLDANPSIWILIAIAIALILTYFGYRGNEARVERLEASFQSKLDALQAERSALSARISQLEGLLENERRLRGVDVLTGLPNHHRFDLDLEVLMSKPKEAEAYSLIYVDLFGLQTINDTQGDVHGSRFIQIASSVIAQAMYRKESIYRAGVAQVEDRSTSEIYRSRDGGDEFFLLMKADILGSVFAMKRIIRDLIGTEDRLMEAAQNPDQSPLDLQIGLRAGIVALADFDTREGAVYEVKNALLHSRLNDLPNAPSRYVIIGTAPEDLSEKERSVLSEIDELIDGKNT